MKIQIQTLLFLGFWLRNEINSRCYRMLSQRFLSLSNTGNVILEGKTGNIFLGGAGGGGGGSSDRVAWLWTPLRDRARGTGLLIAFRTIGDKGYVNSVQPPSPLLFRNSWICLCVFKNLMIFKSF